MNADIVNVVVIVVNGVIVGIVLVGCEAGGTVLLGKRSDQDFSHMIIEERQEKLIPCAYCRFPRH